MVTKEIILIITRWCYKDHRFDFSELIVVTDLIRDIGDIRLQNYQGSHRDLEMKFYDFSMTFHDHFLKIP